MAPRKRVVGECGPLATVNAMSKLPNVEYGERGVALPNEILRSVVGSGVHGIAIEGTDDHDEMGVYIEPPEWILGVERHREDYIWRTQPEGVRSGHGDTDLVLYSLRKYLRLAIKGNPTVMLPLFAPEESLIVVIPWATNSVAFARRFCRNSLSSASAATCVPSTSGCWGSPSATFPTGRS